MPPTIFLETRSNLIIRLTSDHQIPRSTSKEDQNSRVVVYFGEVWPADLCPVQATMTTTTATRPTRGRTAPSPRSSATRWPTTTTTWAATTSSPPTRTCWRTTSRSRCELSFFFSWRRQRALERWWDLHVSSLSEPRGELSQLWSRRRSRFLFLGFYPSKPL